MIIKSEEGHVLTHLGLGDHFTCNGLVRELYKRHPKLYVYSKLKYFYSVEQMYEDLPNLTVLPMEESGAELFVRQHQIRNFYKVSIGSDVTAERSFYRQAGVDFNKKFESYHVPRNHERENYFASKFDFKGEKYAFVHDDVSRNQIVDNNKIVDRSLSIFRADPCHTSNIFDYCKIIENASEIHTIESCFMFMIDLTFKNIKPGLFRHRYAKSIPPCEYPTNLQNWYTYE